MMMKQCILCLVFPLLMSSYHMTGQPIPHSLGPSSSVSGGSSDATIASSNTAAIQTSFANVFALLGHRVADPPSCVHLSIRPSGYPYLSMRLTWAWHTYLPLSPSCVMAEHSMYLKALISLASRSPCSFVTGACLFCRWIERGRKIERKEGRQAFQDREGARVKVKRRRRKQLVAIVICLDRRVESCNSPWTAYP